MAATGTAGNTTYFIGAFVLNAAFAWLSGYLVWRAVLWLWVRCRWRWWGFGARQRARWQTAVREGVEAIGQARDAHRFAYDLTIRAHRRQFAFYTFVNAGSAAGAGAVLMVVARHLPWTGEAYVTAALVVAVAGAIAGEVLTIGGSALHTRWTTEPIERASLAVGALLRDPRSSGYTAKRHRAESGHQVIRAFVRAGIPVAGLEEARIASNESDEEWARLRRVAVDRLARAYRGDFVDGEVADGFRMDAPALRAGWLPTAASAATVLGLIYAVASAWLPYLRR